MVVTIDNKKGPGVDFRKDFDANLPVVAVFVTNCKCFVLNNMGMEINVNDGNLTKKSGKVLPLDTVGLRGNVSVRFMFC